MTEIFFTSDTDTVVELRKWLAKMIRHEKDWTAWPIASGRYQAYKDVQKKIRNLLRRKKCSTKKT